MTDRTKRPKGLQTMTLAELLERQFEPRAVLVAPWLKAAESALLWAPSGVGKSLLVNTLALAVAGGGTVAGWHAERPRKVLLVDGEMHIADLRDRLQMLAQTVGGIDLGEAGRNLTILSRQDQGPEARFPDLAETVAANPSTEAGQEVIFRKIRETGAELVILDNFSTLAEVADENEAAAMTPILTFLMRLKQANVACILVHHASKSGTDFRGSSKLATTFEVIIGLVRPEGHSVTDGACFELLWKKYRGRPSAATRDSQMRLEVDADEAMQWVSSPTASAQVLAVVDSVKSGAFTTQQQIAEALGVQPYVVARAKVTALTQGLISKAEWAMGLQAGLEERFEDF